MCAQLHNDDMPAFGVFQQRVFSFGGAGAQHMFLAL